MAVTDEIVSVAGNMENYPQWKSWMKHMKKIGYRQINGEARCYYRFYNGSFFYRRVTEAEMHRYK